MQGINHQSILEEEELANNNVAAHHQALPLQSQDTEIVAPSSQPNEDEAPPSHNYNHIDELHLVQNPSVDQVHQSVVQEDESLPVTGSMLQPIVLLNSQRFNQQRSGNNVNSNNDLLDHEEADVDNMAAALGAGIISQPQLQSPIAPPLRRGLTLDSANISNNNRESTASFDGTPMNQGGGLNLNNNPFASMRQNSGASGSFLSSIGQRAQEGAFRPMQPLEPRFLLNPFSRLQSNVTAPVTSSSRQQRPSSNRHIDLLADDDSGDEGSVPIEQPSNSGVIRLEEQKQQSENDDFARMLADNNSSQAAGVAPQRSSLGTDAPVSPIQQTTGVSNNNNNGSSSGNQDQSRLNRSRSMHDTFAQARPFGLLSGITNQRVPDQPGMRRQSSFRSNQQVEDNNVDVRSASSLSLQQQVNDAASMSPSPAARQRYMNVPGLPRASSRISNSDRHSQASGTPRDNQQNRRLLSRSNRPLAPVSPLPNQMPSLLASDVLPNLSNRLARQPNTPNPSGQRQYMRISSLQIDHGQPDEVIDIPNSEAELSTRSNMNRGGEMGIPQITSRRSLLEPLRSGEEIFSPTRPSIQPTRPSNSIRPLVPVEPLAPVPEEGVLIHASSGVGNHLINPVPHVELQPTANFAPIGDRPGVPQRSLTYSGSGFNIRLHPARESPSARPLTRTHAHDWQAASMRNLVQRRRPGIIMNESPLNVQNLQRSELLMPARNTGNGRGISSNRPFRIGAGNINSAIINAPEETRVGLPSVSRISTGRQGSNDLDERILRSLIGTQPRQMRSPIRSNQDRINFEHSDDESNSNESDKEDDDPSSEELMGDQDSILDSASNNEDSQSKCDSEQMLVSQWSEADQILCIDETDLQQELTLQNQQNDPSRHVDINQVLDQKLKQNKLAIELGKQYGALAVVLFNRASKFGSLLDHNLLKELSGARTILTRISNIKSRINYMVIKFLTVIQDCFAALNTKVEIEKGKNSTLKAYQFLKMIYKILPDNLEKLQRKTLEDTIPNLLKLSQELESIQQQSILSPGMPKKKWLLEKRAQFYVRELLMTKVIVDFKIQYHLSTGVTSSSQTRKLTLELLPFAIKLCKSISDRLSLALYHKVLKITASLPPLIWPVHFTSKQDNKQNSKVDRLHGGFVAVHPEKVNIIKYYRQILAEQYSIHQNAILGATLACSDERLSCRKRSDINNAKEASSLSKIKQKRNQKKLRKQQMLYTML